MEKSYMDTLNKNMLQFDNKISAANTLYKNIATNAAPFLSVRHRHIRAGSFCISATTVSFTAL